MGRYGYGKPPGQVIEPHRRSVIVRVAIDGYYFSRSWLLIEPLFFDCKAEASSASDRMPPSSFDSSCEGLTPSGAADA